MDLINNFLFIIFFKIPSDISVLNYNSFFLISFLISLTFLLIMKVFPRKFPFSHKIWKSLLIKHFSSNNTNKNVAVVLAGCGVYDGR